MITESESKRIELSFNKGVLADLERQDKTQFAMVIRERVARLEAELRNIEQKYKITECNETVIIGPDDQSVRLTIELKPNHKLIIVSP